MKLLIIALLSFACGPRAAAQVFPFDRACDTTFFRENVRVVSLEEHTRLFGNGTVTMEVYYEPVEITKRDDGWAMSTRCTETIFVHKKPVAGKALWACAGSGRYLFLFYRDGCYLVQEMEFLPDKSSSTHFELFGKCPPQRTKSM